MALSSNDQQFMAHALRLAERGRYTTRPNPRVGCVLVKDEQVIAKGWHYRAGEAHAEVCALRQLTGASQAQAIGATAYVTLEPCSHQGRTGSCATALISAGVTRVVYAMQDPNPLVAGQGLARLQASGIQVDGPLLESQALALNKGFVKRMQQQLPWVRCKLAASLDGRTAMASGESQWITGAAARSDVQRLRAQHCAIVTGIGSIEQDDSRLTLRQKELSEARLFDASLLTEKAEAKVGAEVDAKVDAKVELEHQQAQSCIEDVIALSPLRVVMDSQLRISPNAALFEGLGVNGSDNVSGTKVSGMKSPVIIFTGSDVSIEKEAALLSAVNAGNQLSIERIDYVEGGSRIDLAQALRVLAQQYDCNEVMIEAGATLSGAFFTQGLVDELVMYQAPILLGSRARPLLDLPIDAMADKWTVDVTDRTPVGDDIRITANVVGCL